MESSQNQSQVPPKKTGVARLVAATRYSFKGLKATLASEEAFRLEAIAFCVLTPIALWLGESAIERTLLIGSLVIVLIVELLNSAIEAVVDRGGLEFDELAGKAKDIGSAAVFVAMMLVLFIWGMLLL